MFGAPGLGINPLDDPPPGELDPTRPLAAVSMLTMTGRRGPSVKEAAGADPLGVRMMPVTRLVRREAGIWRELVWGKCGVEALE